MSGCYYQGYERSGFSRLAVRLSVSEQRVGLMLTGGVLRRKHLQNGGFPCSIFVIIET